MSNKVYTMKEISAATGTGLPAVCTLLQKLGHKPLRREGRHLVYSEDALNEVKAHARPRQPKLTVEEIAKMAGTDERTVSELAEKNGMRVLRVTVTKIYPAYSGTDAQKIVRLLQEKPEKTQREKWLDEQRKKHPLVTDMRCFDLNYWP